MNRLRRLKKCVQKGLELRKNFLKGGDEGELTTEDGEEMELGDIAALIEESDAQLSIFLVEKEKAHSLESPETNFDIAKTTKEFQRDRSQAKAVAKKFKNGSKPASRLVGGCSDVANSSNATPSKVKA